VALLAGSLAAAGTYASTAMPARATATAPTPLVKPDFAFFKGKTIKWNVNSPGATAYTIAQITSQRMAAILKAKINLIPHAGTQNISANITATAKPDGLTIGSVGILSNVTNEFLNIKSFEHDLAKQTFFGAMPQGAYIFVSCNGSQYKSFDQLRAAKSEVKVITIVSSASAVEVPLLFKAFKVPYRTIGGYDVNTGAVGCQRGDGDVLMSTAATLINAESTAFPPGITPLMVLSKVPPKSKIGWLNNTAPLLETYVANNLPPTPTQKRLAQLSVSFWGGVAQSVFGPTGIPKARAAALSSAWLQSANTAANKVKLRDFGLTPTPYKPEVIVPFIIEFRKLKPVIQRAIG